MYRQGCHTFLHLTLGTLNFAETIELLLVNWLKTLAVCKNVKQLCSVTDIFLPIVAFLTYGGLAELKFRHVRQGYCCSAEVFIDL